MLIVLFFFDKGKGIVFLEIVYKPVCKERKGSGNKELPEFNPQDGL